MLPSVCAFCYIPFHSIPLLHQFVPFHCYIVPLLHQLSCVASRCLKSSPFGCQRSRGVRPREAGSRASRRGAGPKDAGGGALGGLLERSGALERRGSKRRGTRSVALRYVLFFLNQGMGPGEPTIQLKTFSLTQQVPGELSQCSRLSPAPAHRWPGVRQTQGVHISSQLL